MTLFRPAALALCFGLLLGAGPGLAAPDAPTRPATVLFWSQPEREHGFAHMEDVFPVHVVSHGDHALPLPAGKPLTVKLKTGSIEQFMAEQKTSGLLVIQNGRVRLERYGLGHGPDGRWTSFSVAKSFTSTLVGAAVADGYIRSLDNSVSDYMPGLKGSAYEGVSIRQLLTMTSGVKWNESYTDPNSDVARMYSVPTDPRFDATVGYMRTLPRESAPGAKWVYKTGETDLIGALVTAATHKTLAAYLTEKIWRPLGMEHDAVWMHDAADQDRGGCCISVALRDYGRMGVFLLGGATIDGKSILPQGWLEAATRKQADIGAPGHGYGYQWWTNDDGSYDARGIFGQMIRIDPKRRLVVVINSAWPKATDSELSAHRQALLDAIDAAVDADPQG